MCASRQLFCRGFVTASHLQRFDSVLPARRRDHIEMFSLCRKKGRRGSTGADESFEIKELNSCAETETCMQCGTGNLL